MAANYTSFLYTAGQETTGVIWPGESVLVFIQSWPEFDLGIWVSCGAGWVVLEGATRVSRTMRRWRMVLFCEGVNCRAGGARCS